MSIRDIFLRAVICLTFIIFHDCSWNRVKDPQNHIEIQKVYGKSTPEDKQEIQRLFKIMVEAILEEDMQRLLPYIDKNDGVWVDLKAGWTKKDYIKDLQNPDGYISTYFLSTESLRKKKENPSALSVKDVLKTSGGFLLEYYFESPEECELHIYFQGSREHETDVNNPVFRKNKGKWYIYRLL